jgi:hypothetical protein
MSSIHFIGGEKGGVGKSVLARLLAQYFIDKAIPFTGFDADPSHGALLRFYTDYCRPVDLYRFESADAIFTEAVEGAGQTVLVDLPAQAERPLALWMENSGILELAAESNVQLVFWHVMDEGKDSITLLGRLFARFGDRVNYFIVKNHGRGKDFSTFDSSGVKVVADRLQATILELPELHGPAMRTIDRLDASFWAAANASAGAESLPRLDRQRVRVWLHRIYEKLANIPQMT